MSILDTSTYDLEIPEGILTKAVKNTVEILKDQIQVIE